LLSGSTSITRFEVPPLTFQRVGNTRTHSGGDTLVINACNGDCPRGYNPKIEIVSPYFSGIAAKSGGKVIAQGQFPSQSSLGVAAMSGGEIDVRAMTARSVGAYASAGGIIRTRPLASLGATASAGGRILYSGDPKVGMHVETGGTVTRAD
jgi:formylmethanofuran dehydrogenase subunit C